MVQTANFPRFSLKKGLEFTVCNPSIRCEGTETFGYTRHDSIVELVVQRDLDGTPVSATAYMPSQAACISRELPGPPECELDLLFEGEQLEQLISSTPITQVKLADSKQNSKSELETHTSLEGAVGPSPNPARMISGLNPYYALGGIAIFTLITIAFSIRRLQKRDLLLRSIVRDKSHSQNTFTAMRSSSHAQALISRSIARSFATNSKMTGVGSQCDLDKQIEDILLRLDSLEQQMTSVLVRTSFRDDKIDESV